MSENTCTLSDGAGALPDWIELYNPTSENLGLDRVAMWDSSGIVWMGPAGQSLAPGAYLLIYADGTGVEDHTPWSLDSDGDTLTLSVDGEVVDRMNMGMIGDDISWARFPDGGGWDVTVDVTPGASNGTTPSRAWTRSRSSTPSTRSTGWTSPSTPPPTAASAPPAPPTSRRPSTWAGSSTSRWGPACAGP